MPYTINGKSFPEFSAQSEEFSRALAQNSLLTGTTDEMLVMAAFSGMNDKVFRDTCREYLATGNYQKLGKLAAHINQNMRDG